MQMKTKPQADAGRSLTRFWGLHHALFGEDPIIRCHNATAAGGYLSLKVPDRVVGYFTFIIILSLRRDEGSASQLAPGALDVTPPH